MARRGGRRGRRSRSKQRSRGAGTRSSKAKSSKSRSRNTRGSGARKSAPSKRRNTRTTTRASNRRATVSKARRAAPKRTAPKKKAPTKRATPSNRRATVSKQRQQQRATQTAPKKAVNAAVGKPATSKRQATRINRKPPVKASTVFNNALKGIQNRNLVADKRINAITNPRGALKEADAARKGIRQEVKNPGFLDSILNRNNELQKQINNLGSNVTNSAGTFANALMGIIAANAQPMNTRPKMLANLPADYKQQEQALSAAADASRYKSLSIDQQRAVQQGKYGETFGLNPVTQRNEINRIQNMIKAQNAARVRQGLDPTFSGQSLKEARDADGDGYADNMGNRIAGVYNATLGRVLPKMPKQTVAGANISMNRPMGQRLPGLVSRRGSSGGTSRIQQQAAATQMQPEIAPTIGQPIEETGAAPTVTGGGAEDLTRIQSQAYNTQLTSSLAGMFGGQGSVGYTPQGSPELSPTLRAGQSRGRRRVRLFGARRRRGGTGDQFSRAGDRIAKLTNINI